MIFWILAVIILAAIVYGFYWSFSEQMGDSWIGCTVFGGLLALVSVLVGGLLGAGIIALSALAVPVTLAEQRDTDLRAVSASSSVEGRFFLGSGYVNGVRTLNYVVALDGYSELRQAKADNSRIYEDENGSPYVTSYEWVKEAWWLAPGSLDMGTTYDFHIPEDSILEDFTVDNAG